MACRHALIPETMPWFLLNLSRYFLDGLSPGLQFIEG
jgi:hypothetical protein